MQLEVINNSAVAPRWAVIRDASARAYEDFKFSRPYSRLRKARLLTPPGANTKLSKGTTPIYGLTLAPAGASGYQLCPWRSPECEAACLGITSGRSRFSNVQQARIEKTRFLMQDSYFFFRQLLDELAAARRKHFVFAFRSNVLSDIPWESVAPEIYSFANHNYDYTKSFHRAMESLNMVRPRLHLTLSYSGHNWQECREYLLMGGNVAMVFNVAKGKALPNKHEGWAVIDGDLTDARFNDPMGGVIVGLRAKGSVKPRNFVVQSV